MLNVEVIFKWNAYRYFPYERILAARELQSLFGTSPIPSKHGLAITVSDMWEDSALRATYFKEAISEKGARVIPSQTIIEAYSNGNRERINLADISTIDLRRQSTRYSAHGIHEYKGKFNPQMMRAIANMLGIKQGQLLLDPFCGSGTSLLEASLNGWNAVGIDINPLGVEIAKAKLAAHRIPAEVLNSNIERLIAKLMAKEAIIINNCKPFSKAEIIKLVGKNWQPKLPCYNYLSNWFSESVLAQLLTITKKISDLKNDDVQLILRIILSDLLRDVSQQNPSDLRIRRRKVLIENMPVISKFISAVNSKISSILAAKEVTSAWSSKQYAILGDIRDSSSFRKQLDDAFPSQSFDAAITSPPYATALPYIDTQRLSLVLLNLINADQIRQTEKRLIGNREISNRERLNIEASIVNNRNNLPDECISICRELIDAIDIENDGFRKKNIPALLYQYFTDMGAMFANVNNALKRGAPYALIVGKNTTRLGEKNFVIDTPLFLSKLSEQYGFAVEEIIKLDTYHRYDMHHGNSIRSESLVILRAHSHES